MDDIWESTPFGLNNLVTATQLSKPSFLLPHFHHLVPNLFLYPLIIPACEFMFCQTVRIDYFRSTSQDLSIMVQIYTLDSYLYHVIPNFLPSNNHPFVSIY